MGNPPAPGHRDHPPAEEHVMPLVNVKLAEGVYTEKQKHDLAARLTAAAVSTGPRPIHRSALMGQSHQAGPVR